MIINTYTYILVGILVYGYIILEIILSIRLYKTTKKIDKIYNVLCIELIEKEINNKISEGKNENKTKRK